MHMFLMKLAETEIAKGIRLEPGLVEDLAKNYRRDEFTEPVRTYAERFSTGKGSLLAEDVAQNRIDGDLSNLIKNRGNGVVAIVVIPRLELVEPEVVQWLAEVF